MQVYSLGRNQPQRQNKLTNWSTVCVPHTATNSSRSYHSNPSTRGSVPSDATQCNQVSEYLLKTKLAVVSHGKYKKKVQNYFFFFFDKGKLNPWEMVKTPLRTQSLSCRFPRIWQTILLENCISEEEKIWKFQILEAFPLSTNRH